MEQDPWVDKVLNELIASSKDYRQKALFLAVIKLKEEQNVRIEQAEGQLDGTLWSPREWEN